MTKGKVTLKLLKKLKFSCLGIVLLNNKGSYVVNISVLLLFLSLKIHTFPAVKKVTWIQVEMYLWQSFILWMLGSL